MFTTLADQASLRYRPCGITAWQFARGKLRGDPVYQSVFEGPWLKQEGRILDLGCGQGLMLALIAAARERATPDKVSETAQLIGIETRPKVAAIARKALGNAAEIIAADARHEKIPSAQTILVFDVLHMMPAPDQEALLRGLVSALEPGGTLLLREADAGAGWRFQAVNFANRAKAFFFGYSSREFHFRTAQSWQTLLSAHGLTVTTHPMGTGTPYGNILLAGTKPGRT